jgi:3-oxoacyl-[acyl-carrier protein] reductase
MSHPRNGRLQGKKTIVTGASKGIGAAIARFFVMEGADVLVNYNSSETQATELVESLNDEGPGRAFLVRGNVSKVDEIRAMVSNAKEKMGRIDVLVNNAGIIIRNDFFSSTEEEFDRIIDVNLKGTFFSCKEVAPTMIEQKKGSIINIASISGLAQPSALAYPNYVASKAGVIGVTRALAVKLAPFVRVNAVSPGTIETDMVASLPEESKRNAVAEAFLKRLGRPDDIASACVFLASDESDFVTGEILTVSGGRAMR